MSARVDLVIVGAGPAGMAAAVEAAGLGVAAVVVDEQPEPGGQIYRAVERVCAERRRDLAILGEDYARGAELAGAFRATPGLDYRAGTGAWQIEADGTVASSDGTDATLIRARQVLVATGAMERAVAVPGWTLPGVMGAGAAQVLLKSAGMVPAGPVVLAGAGPLLLLVAAQLVDAGAEVAAVLETTTWRHYLDAAPALPAALRAPGYLRKGLALRSRLRRAGVPVRGGVRALAMQGASRVEAVRYRVGGREHSVRADTVLLHDGVVPNVQLTRQVRCAHAWHPVQRYWHPVVDRWGATSVERVHVAGDTGGVLGALAAEAAGRIAALDIAGRLGRIDSGERDARASALRVEHARHAAIRPLLDRLFAPHPEFLAPDAGEVVVCRCEEVTVDGIRAAVAAGCLGPNQLKSYARCGMGPCQGRLCGLTASEVIAAARGVPVPEVGYYRIRPPIKPLTLGEVARLASD